MIEALQRFVARLRELGLPVSPAEAIDAARALRAVGVDRRDSFRQALRVTLVKSRDDLEAFDRAFDRFFVAPRKAGGRRRRGAAAGMAGEGPKGRSRPGPAGAAAGGPAARAAPVPPQTPDARRSRPGRLRILLAPRPQRGAMTRPGLHVPEAPRRGAPSRHRRAGERAADAADPRAVDLAAPLSSDEEARIAREVPRLVREVRLRAGRRSMRSPRGRPWMPRLMRRSAATGGVPFVLPRRKARPRRPRVLVLADASWSVQRASSLFLMMAGGFLKARGRARVHLFVDRCIDATGPLARWDGEGPASFARFLESIEELDPRAASDYGRAFHQAARSGRAAVAGRRDTLLVVLGDARSNLRDPQAWAFEDLAARCRKVIWLVPEPASRWDTGDSILREYAPFCDVICEARDLGGIARGVAALVRSL